MRDVKEKVEKAGRGSEFVQILNILTGNWGIWYVY